MYADVDTATAGAAFPQVTALPVEGGYLASGRWSYHSGVTHPDWVQLRCRTGAADCRTDLPEFVRLVAPSSDATVLESWRTTGM